MSGKPVDPDGPFVTWGWIGAFFFMPLAFVMSIILMTRKRFGHAIPMFVIVCVWPVAVFAYVFSAETTADQSPAATTTTERTVAGEDDAASASWLEETLGNDMEDQYGASVTMGDVACITTDHGTSKCSAHYDNEGDEWVARIVVTPATDDYPSTYSFVDEKQTE
jgi:hypothetical protein